MANTTSSASGTALRSVTLEVADVEAARTFYRSFGVDHRVELRASEAGTAGFRGFTLALTVAGPSTVDHFFDAAVGAGATVLKPAAKGFWGYSGVVQAPDGTIWKIATSAKKDDGPATHVIDDLVLLIGVESVKATRQFYVDRGLTVARSFGGKYAEFVPAADGSVKLALYKRKALAKDLGVPVEGEGSHRVVLAGGVGSFTDPDGFAWEAAA
ncbi:glyoxalase [Kitasatospora sp. NPDC051853]|uniref:glyoxalase n=1 Tax=Kitasatospora sp. NPDC051853 TaxID=3364058 RepID=UPI0037B338CF